MPELNPGLTRGISLLEKLDNDLNATLRPNQQAAEKLYEDSPNDPLRRIMMEMGDRRGY